MLWKSGKISTTTTKTIQKKLLERAENPHNIASQWRGFENTYKIKLRSAGYRLVYEVNDNEIVIYVIAVGKRERGLVYAKAEERT